MTSIAILIDHNIEKAKLLLDFVQVLIIYLTSFLDIPKLFHRDLTLSWSWAAGDDWPGSVDFSHEPIDLCADTVISGASNAISRPLDWDFVGTLFHHTLYSLVEVVVLPTHVHFNFGKAFDCMS